jgi:hypothetical protein
VAGTLVVKKGTLNLGSGVGDGSLLVQFTPEADVRWSAVVFSHSYSPGTLVHDSGSTFAADVSLVVDGVTAFAFRWGLHDWQPRTLVLPWGDGLTFSGSQVVQVVVVDNNTSSLLSATLIGRRV